MGDEGGELLISYGVKTIIESYWDMDTSQQSFSSGGVGKTTTEMKTPVTYVEWDSGIWNFVQDEYPKLWFEE